MDKEHGTGQQLLAELSTILKYHRQLGIASYPEAGKLQAFLNRRPSEAAGETGAKLPPEIPSRKPKNTTDAENVVLRLADIEEEIRACRACPLHLERLFPIVGDGGDTIRLLVVGDWLAAGSGAEKPVNRKFGDEEDQMLARMLTAIKLPRQAVYVTNVIKCALPENRQPTADHVQQCLSHLQRQIKALKPECICAMGMVAVRVMLNKSQPLSALRGNFHRYFVTENWTVPLLATYHPKFLLQNPEMKKAAWSDLQMLAKKMGLL